MSHLEEEVFHREDNVWEKGTLEITKEDDALLVSFSNSHKNIFTEKLTISVVSGPVESGLANFWFSFTTPEKEHEFTITDETKATLLTNTLKSLMASPRLAPSDPEVSLQYVSPRDIKEIHSNIKDRVAMMQKRRSWRNVSKSVKSPKSLKLTAAHTDKAEKTTVTDKTTMSGTFWVKNTGWRKSAPMPPKRSLSLGRSSMPRPALAELADPGTPVEGLSEKSPEKRPKRTSHRKSRRCVDITPAVDTKPKAGPFDSSQLQVEYPRIDLNLKDWKFDDVTEVSSESFSEESEEEVPGIGVTEYKPQRSTRIMARGKTIRAEQDSPRRQERRKNIVNEILSTELSYVHSLGLCIKSYFKPLCEKAEAMGEIKANVSSIFGNIEVLHGFNSRMLIEIQKVVEKWTPLSLMGPVFIQFSPFLKMYTDYSNKYTEAIEKLNNLLLKNTKFKKEVAAGHKESGWKLTDLLIMPIQRIPRYSLLMKDLQDHTPASHPDWVLIHKALQTIGDVATHVNEEVRRRENHLRLQEMQQEGINLNGFIQPARYMVRDGLIRVALSDPLHPDRPPVVEHHYWVLFNDILVHCKKDLVKNVDLHDHQYIWPLSLIWVTEEKGEKKTKTKLIYPNLNITFGNKYIGWADVLRDTLQTHLATKIGKKGSNAGENEGEVLRFSEFRDLVGGDVYKGQWLDGMREGLGTWTFFGNEYKGYWEKNKPNGKGRLKYKTGEEYYGMWKDGLQHGRGTLKLSDGSRCIANWSRGMRNGSGKILYSNGDLFEGQWKKDRICGLGSLIKKCGLIYKGDWEANTWHGVGKLTLPDGTTYEGEFQNGSKQGRGKQTYQEGAFYVGTFQFDLRHGTGTLTEPNGSIYNGSWQYDSREGQGKQLYQDGTVYDGPWVNNLRHGANGTATNPMGSKFIGDWEFDRRHGKGTFYDALGNDYKGTWVKDILDGKGEVNYADGSKFVGFFTLGQKSKGTMTFKNPKTSPFIRSYDGDWSHGRMHGKGILTYKNGTVIKGTFNNGNLHGESTCIWNNMTEVCKYTDGTKDGKFTLAEDGHILLNGMVISNTIILPNTLQLPIAPSIPDFPSLTGFEMSEAGTTQLK